MKWIGQHIVDSIARFRSDVYLDSPTAGGSDPDKFLGIDSNGKIIYRTGAEVLSDIGGGDGDITGVTIQTDSGSGSKATDTAGSADFSILGANGVGVTNSGTTITAVAVPAEIDHDSLNNFEENVHFRQSAIETVGTIGSGTWQGTAIASAYLDADTMHYSAQRQLTHYMFRDGLNTTKHYVGLQEADAESETASNKNLAFLAPVAGKLLKVYLRATTDLSGKEFTWTLETHNSSSSTGGTPTVVGTVVGAGCTASSMTTYNFVSPTSGDNIIDAGDTVQLAITSDASASTANYYITCLWEWDLS